MAGEFGRSFLANGRDAFLRVRGFEILRLSARLDDWQAEWNTFGSGLYLLEATVNRYGDRLEQELGAKRYALLTSRLKAAIAADK